MIEKALNKLGYYKCTVPEGEAVSEAEIMELFRTYGQTKVFKNLLATLCETDKNLYFMAVNDKERDSIQGAYRRTAYFISLIQKSNGKK